MSDDSEVSNNSAPDDLNSIVWDSISGFPFFLLFMTIILYITTSTATFNSLLKNVNEKFIKQENDEKSNSGIIVTGITLGILLAILHIFNSNNII